MSLPQIECPDCHERHLLWRGRMAVHATAAGLRCDGTINAPKRPVRTKAEPAEATRQAAKGTKKPRPEMTQRDHDATHGNRAGIHDPDLLEAFSVANERKGRGRPADSAAPERVIYLTKTTRIVSGGLPSLGRGR
nr:hypothetical protein BJQ95_02395 [Cryobacterium sp. SO1]